MAKIPSLTRQLAYAAADLVHHDTPISHDQLSRLFGGTGLAHADPGADGYGKTKRMRAVLDYAAEHDRHAGARLLSRLVASLRASGGFRHESETYIGTRAFANLRDAYRASNFELDDDGMVRRRVLDDAEALESDEVLSDHIRRIQRGASDAPLITGGGKDLLEASARRVLHTAGREYPGHDFPGTLYHAFLAAGFASPSPAVMQAVRREMSADPRTRLQEVLYVLACTINQLRNSEGTGHGRAFLSTLSTEEAQVAAKAMALISEMLLTGQGDSPSADADARRAGSGSISSRRDRAVG